MLVVNSSSLGFRQAHAEEVSLITWFKCHLVYMMWVTTMRGGVGKCQRISQCLKSGHPDNDLTLNCVILIFVIGVFFSLDTC